MLPGSPTPRTTRSATVGQQQAKLYADCLEAQFQRRPIVFYTNGYQHWIWDDASYPPRQVQGFYKKQELELLLLQLAHARLLQRQMLTRCIRRCLAL